MADDLGLEEFEVCSNTSPERCAAQKDHDVHSEDITELVSVRAFKERCTDLGDVFEYYTTGTDVTGAASLLDVGTNDVTNESSQLNAAPLVPPSGLESILKGTQPWMLITTPLKCLNQFEAQKEYFDRKYLHNFGMQVLASRPGYLHTYTQELCRKEAVAHPEVILSLTVFHPTKKRRDIQMLVLGSQLLTELRDMISCYRDYITDTDYSENPHCHKPHNCLRVPSPSAFFFINNTFYNDMRSSQKDLSRPILEWVESGDRAANSPRLDHFATAAMETTRFDQLSLRLGYPYLYCHHDNCQHLIVFTDLRLLHPTDSQIRSDYPRAIATFIGKWRKCSVCSIFPPVWITLEDDLANESPCLFCEDCFMKLHYSAEGKKICRFKAFLYNPSILI